MKRACVAAMVALAVVLVLPSLAYAQRTWSEGTDTRPLSVRRLDRVEIGEFGSAPGARLERAILWQYSGPSAEFDPFSVEVLGSGNVLVTSRSNEILEVTRGGKVVWSYTRLQDNPQLNNAYAAQRLPNGNTLITDRRADFVIEVTRDKRIVWRYGATRDSVGPGDLFDPFAAQRLPNGNTLITDNRGGNRVIEVRTSDYDPSAPNMGYTDSSIVWQYGRAGVAGIGPGLLVSPRHAIQAPNGNVLICDAGDRDAEANRVIEVTKTGQIVWSFGVPGVAGRDETHLDRPSAAQWLNNGHVLVVEEDGGRMLEIDRSGTIVDSYGGAGAKVPPGGEVAKLRGVHRTSSGTMLVDQANGRLIEIGSPSSGQLESESLSLGMPGVLKVVRNIQVKAETPSNTSVSISYSLDHGPWKTGGASVTLPKDSVASSIRYRLTLKTSDHAATPLIREVKIGFDVAQAEKPATTKTESGGTGTTSGSGTGSRSGSGSGRGAGTSGGTGSGIGTGAGAGSGSGGTALKKSGGAGTLVPSGIALGVGAGSMQIHSGFVMESVGGSGLAAGSAAARQALAVDPADSAAAGLLLGTCYLIGFAEPQFARAFSSMGKGIGRRHLGANV